MNLLALDCSTEHLSLAVQHGSQVLQHTSAGGAQTSLHLLPQLLALMQQAGLRFEQLDAIAFGRGPGSFTGLRSACAVAQGLGFAAGVPLLPVDSLLALAQAARAPIGAAAATRVLATLDARMDEVYVGYYDFDSDLVNKYQGNSPISPEDLDMSAPASQAKPGAASPLPMRPQLWAGNARAAYAARWPATLLALSHVQATPTAQAMLALAPALLRAGHAVSADHALPLYSRDKVALTTLEREAAQAARAASN